MTRRFLAGAIAPALLLALLVFATFAPGLGGRFLFDDYPNVVSNRYIQMESLDAASLARAARAYEAGPVGRPLATITFALDHLRGGRDPAPYKLTSLAVHVFNALLVFLLLRRLLTVAWPVAPAGVAAFTVALAWAAHPLQVSTVLYVVQRMETLATTFVLLALLAYCAGRRRQIEGRGGWGWIAGSGALALTGALAKESALLFPLYAGALELSLLRFNAARPETSGMLRRCWAAAGVAMAGVAIAAAVHYADPAKWALRDFTSWERLLTQLRVLCSYLGMILWPVGDQMPFYYDDLEPSRGLLSPWTTAAGGALLAALLASAVVWRHRFPLYAVGVFWFFAAHFLTSWTLPLELSFEHRNYFALLGVLLVIADIVVRVVQPRERPAAKFAIGAVVACVLVLGAIRSATWGDPFLLAVDMTQRNPMSARAANDLGEQYMVLAGGNPHSPYYQFAEREFQRGAALPRASVLPEQALILLAATAGRATDTEAWEGLREKLATRVIGPQDRSAIVGLLEQRQRGLPIDDHQLAMSYSLLAERHWLPAPHLARFADHALVHAGDPVLAEKLFVLAVDHSVDDPAYMLQLAEVLTKDGHARHAEAVIAAAARHGVVIR